MFVIQDCLLGVHLTYIESCCRHECSAAWCLFRARRLLEAPALLLVQRARVQCANRWSWIGMAVLEHRVADANVELPRFGFSESLSRASVQEPLEHMALL